MKIIIQPNGESNVKEIKCFNPDGLTYYYTGENAQYLIKCVHEALIEENMIITK